MLDSIIMYFDFYDLQYADGTRSWSIWVTSKAHVALVTKTNIESYPFFTS